MYVSGNGHGTFAALTDCQEAGPHVHFPHAITTRGDHVFGNGVAARSSVKHLLLGDVMDVAGENSGRFGSGADGLLELRGPDKMEGNVFQKDVGGIGGNGLTEFFDERAELLPKSLLCVTASGS